MPSFFEATCTVPVLETERLILRESRLEDFPELLKIEGDPVVMRYIGGKQPPTQEETWMRFLRNPGHWALFGFGNWSFINKASGQYIGGGGIAYYKREIEPALENIPELGYVLASHVHGKGYASEAVAAILAWSDAHFGDRPTKCLISSENRASLRVAEKAGYLEFARTTYKDRPSILFTRTGKTGAAGEIKPKSY
jgi:RimJ/RimL family protein N-acetyltransferase